MASIPTPAACSVVPVANNQNTSMAGAIAPMPLQDAHLFDNLAHRIGERTTKHTVPSGTRSPPAITSAVARHTKVETPSPVGKSTERATRSTTAASARGLFRRRLRAAILR